MKKSFVFGLAFLFAAPALWAQNKIKDGSVLGSSSLPCAGAIFEMESLNRGALFPRITLDSTTVWGLSGPAIAGMVVYNVNPTIVAGTAAAPTLPGGVGLYYWDGSRWVGASATAGKFDFWALKGNAGTYAPSLVGSSVDTFNYWGTQDAQNLAVGTNGITRMIFDQQGNAYGGNASYVRSSSALSSFAWGANNVDSLPYSQVFGVNNNLHLGINSNSPFVWPSAVFGSYNDIASTGTFAAGTALTTNGDNINGVALFGNDNHIIAGNSGANLLAGQANIIQNTAATGLAFPSNSAWHTVVFGLRDTVELANESSNRALVFGERNRLDGGPYTFLGGYGNKVKSTTASAILGYQNVDSSDYTFMAGQGNVIPNSTNHAAVVGKYNKPEPNMLFAVGSGTSTSARANSFVVTNKQTTGAGVNGDIIMAPKMPWYATQAAAQSDASLPVGAMYRCYGTASGGGNYVMIKN